MTRPRGRPSVAARRAALLGSLLAGLVATPPGAEAQRYPHADEPIGSVREVYDGTLSPEMAVNTFRNIDRLFPSRRIAASTRPRPLPVAARQLDSLAFTSRGDPYTLETFFEANRIAGALVIHDGGIVLERYRYGNTPRTRWMSMSVAKSITSTLVGAALEDGLILSLADPVTGYVPALMGTAYEGVSIRDVLMMSSGVRWSETYTDPTSDRRALLEAQIAQRPGGALAVMAGLPRAAEPGTRNTYSTGETQIAAEVLRGALRGPIADYLHDRIWEPFGMEADATWWLESPGGIEIGGSGFSAVLRDYGRFGLFVLGGGRIGDERVLPPGWVEEAGSPKVLEGGEPLDYGYLWWPETSGVARRDGAFAAYGIHGQNVYVNPAVNTVVVLWGAQPGPTGQEPVLPSDFFEAVADALRD